LVFGWQLHGTWEIQVQHNYCSSIACKIQYQRLTEERNRVPLFFLFMEWQRRRPRSINNPYPPILYCLSIFFFSFCALFSSISSSRPTCQGNQFTHFLFWVHDIHSFSHFSWSSSSPPLNSVYQASSMNL
jgi:hypothetical protein